VGPGGGAFSFSNPYSDETLGTDGNLYGTLYQGGTSGKGEVYKVTPGGVLTSLHSFTGAGDGSLPYSAPIESTSGTYYGTTTLQRRPRQHGVLCHLWRGVHHASHVHRHLADGGLFASGHQRPSVDTFKHHSWTSVFSCPLSSSGYTLL